jgi:hypothetical protein
MRNNKFLFLSLAGWYLALGSAVASDALAQSAGRYYGVGSVGSVGGVGVSGATASPIGGSGYRGYYGGTGGYYPAYGGYSLYGASSNFVAPVVSVGPAGGININLANVGSASSFTDLGGGRGYFGPWFGGSFAPVPVFSGGLAFSGNGVDGLNLQLSGGNPGGGGSNINITILPFTSAY